MSAVSHHYIAAESSVSTSSTVYDFIKLLKPRVMSLVVFTGFVGLYLAPGHIDFFTASIAILCIALGSGAAGALNMWYERDIDALMERTKSRPIVTGKINHEEALFFSITIALFSVTIMAFGVNYLAAALLLLAILYYVFLYTIWLKRVTVQNIVIGGAAGALPPMIGWVSVTGSLSIAPFALFAIIFLWTCPHFWALSLYRADDYSKANIPMLPVVYGEKSTCNHIIFYTILTIISSYLPLQFIALNSSAYLICATILNIIFLSLSCSNLTKNNYKMARWLFTYSIFYLFLLFLTLLVTVNN